MLDLPASVLDALPAAAAAKIERAALDREAARVAYRAASDREQEARLDLARAEATAGRQREMPQGFTIGALREDRDERAARIDGPVEAAKRSLEARIAARNRAAEAQEAFAFIEGVESWLRRTTTPGGSFRAVSITAPKSKDAVADVARLRSRLAEIENLFQKVENAPAPKAALLATAHAEIDRVAADGQLRINPADRSGAPLNLASRLSLHPHGSGALIGDGGSSVFIWLLAEILKAEIEEMVAALPDDGSMSDAEREQAFADLAAERLELERHEEALIELAEAQGRSIARRADLDPRAFLSIEA